MQQCEREQIATRRQISNDDYENMTEAWYDATKNIPKNYWILSYLRITISTFNIKDIFVHLGTFYICETQTFLW